MTTTLRIPDLILDPLQRAAAEAAEGPLAIIGGPGTGKTHTLIARAHLLIKGGASPHTIACLTFGTRGAEDIRRQMEQMPVMAEYAPHVFIGTIHHYASCFLRRAGAAAVGISPHFTIWDREQACETITEMMVWNEEEARPLSKREIEEILDWNAKNQTGMAEEASSPKHSNWLRVIQGYQEEKRNQGTLDLDDLIPLTIRAMERKPEVMEIWSRTRTRHLLVDEFQDITPRQYQLISMMTGPTRSVTIAADPNQSINRWKGANPKMLDQFQLDHKANLQIRLLKVNHRGTRTLCDVAKKLTDAPELDGIHHDYQSAIRIGGPEPTLNIFQDKTEAMYKYIIDQAEERVRDGCRWEDMACIYRGNKTLNRMQSQLNQRNIPYTILGEIEKEKNSNTRCVTAMLALSLNPMDRKAFSIAAAVERRNKNRRLNPEIVKRIETHAREKNTNLIEAARLELKDLRPGSQAHQNIRYTINAWQEVNRMLEDGNMQIYDICRHIEGMLAQAQHADLKTVQESQMMKLLTLSQTTPRLGQEQNREFLARFLELQTAATQPDHRGTENEDPFAHHQGMTFSTIHSAKGMQWKYVWVADAIDDSMPGHNWEQDPERDLEEQRVFYVAATRATDELHFCCAHLNDEGGETEPSRFLASLEDMLDRKVFGQGAVDAPVPSWIENHTDPEDEPEPEPDIEPELG